MTETVNDWTLKPHETLSAVVIDGVTRAVISDTEVEGHLNPAEGNLLEKLASEVTDGCIVEIGSLRGKSTIRLARGAMVSKKEVYAIDPHDPFMDGETLVGVADRAIFLRNLLDAGVAHIVKPVYLKSYNVAARWNELIGLLWIDGDHSYEGVSSDINEWVKYVVAGGLIAFHDSYFESVSRAIGELIIDTDYKVVARADATTVIQYKPLVPFKAVKRPDVSALIPAYNASKTIEKAILSAFHQADIQVEVVVCNDASTDDTSAVLKELADTYGDVIKVATNDINQGLAYSLNHAASVATGRYFIELDADDWLQQDCLSAMVKALDEHPEVGFVYGQTQYHGLSSGVYTPKPYQKNIFHFGFASLYAFMYRREAWDNGCRYRITCEIEGRKITIQDWDMALQLTEHMRWDALALREQLVLHYNHQKGSLTDFTNLHNEEVVLAFMARWPFIKIGKI